MGKLLAALLAASVGALLLVGLAAATGPASGKSASGARHLSAVQASKGTVSVALAGDPGKLDPSLTVLQSALQVADFSYDTLVTQLPGGGKIVSNLAAKWRVLSPTAVRFTLHKGVTCTDGTKMTAGVVKRNLDFVSDPKNQSPLLGVYVPPNTKTTANNHKRTVTVTFPSANPFPLQGLGSVHMRSEERRV